MKAFLHKLSIYKTPILYSSSSIFKAMVNLVFSFIMAKFVSPADLGLWTTISLALTYSVFLQGGIINGLNRELPYNLGLGEKEKALKLASVSQIYIVSVSVFLSVIGFMSSMIYPSSDPKLRWGIFTITIIISFTFYQTYLLSTFRSNDSFKNLSFIQYIEGFVTILTLFLVIRFSYYGLIWKNVIVIITSTILLHILRPIKVNFLWDKQIFLDLLKVGFPIFILGFTESVSYTMDKVWIIKWGSQEEVGLYSFAYYSYFVVTLFSTSIASYIYPKMTYKYGVSKDRLILWNYFKRITLYLIIILFPIVCISYILIPFLIENFFSQYILAARPMQLLLIAGFFKACVIGSNVLWSIKHWKLMIIYQVLNSFVFITITYIMYRFYSTTIEALATGVIISTFINFVCGLILSYIGTNNYIK